MMHSGDSSQLQSSVSIVKFYSLASPSKSRPPHIQALTLAVEQNL
jgi:hypothetical protein